MELLIVVYVLFVALGPRRVIGWTQSYRELLARLQGRPPPPRPRWARRLEMLEHAPILGWTCIVLGVSLAFAGQFMLPQFRVPLLVLAMILLFVGPWLI